MVVDCPLSSYSVPAIYLRCLKGAARRAEPTFGTCFRANAPKEANGEARRAEPMLWLLKFYGGKRIKWRGP